MMRLKPHVDVAELAPAMAALADLVAGVDGCSDFRFGPNRDFEGKSSDYQVGFTLDARDEAALATYAEHPEHITLGRELMAHCQGGDDGILVFDLDTSA